MSCFSRKNNTFLTVAKFRLRSKRLALQCFILVQCLCLSSCSTLFNSKQAGDGQKAGSQSESVDEQDSEVNDDPAVTFRGRDPMGDIQINAEIKKAYKNVSNLNQQKKYDQAKTLLNELKVKYPQLSGPDYQLARILFNQKKLDEALLSVDRSIESNQRNYYSLNLKGVILREQGQFEEAKQTYLAAIKVYPPYANSHLNLGVLADIYLGELSLALYQYKIYRKLTGNKDHKISNWILELSRRVKAEQ